MPCQRNEKGIDFEMNKSAIITINDYANYGNRLQNYALQKYLEKNNQEVETIVIKRNIKNKSIKNIFKIPFRDLIFKIKEKIYQKIYATKIHKRNENIKIFSKKYIKENNKVFSDRCLNNEVSQQYDYFFVGSDQVWNPNYINYGLSFFLSGIENNKKNSFSASIGITDLPEDYLDTMISELKTFNKISVREKSAKTLLENKLNKNIELLPDPTMLLTKEEWESIFYNEINIEDKYIMIYSLGPIKVSEKKFIKDIAKKNYYKIIDISKYNSEFYTINPIEFVQLIKNAELVFTDSFHGCVFSILMETPFIVTKRETANSISSRIDTLLEKYSLNNRRMVNVKKMQEKELFYFDKENAKNVLENERRIANEYIKDIIKKS